jgi:hypothetical protein
VVGCDIPALSCDEIEAAFGELRTSGGASQGKIVLGPALDGGYYLVALDRDVWRVHESQATVWEPGSIGLSHLAALFDGSKIAWGGPEVRRQQLQVATALGLATAVLSSTLSDVDEVEDLSAAKDALGIDVNTLRGVTLAQGGVTAAQVRGTARAQPSGWHNGALEQLLRDHGMVTAKLRGVEMEEIASAVENALLCQTQNVVHRLAD